MAVLDALNWPVLRCPRLAGFQVSPEGDRTVVARSNELYTASSVASIAISNNGETASGSNAAYSPGALPPRGTRTPGAVENAIA